jgi:hypothetical protein
MRTLTTAYVAVMLVASLCDPQPTSADSMDRMECFRVNDESTSSIIVTSDLFGEDTLPDGANCTYRARARQICRPVTEDVTSGSVGPIEGDPQGFYQACYRVSCTSSDPVGPYTLTDPFGNRSFTKWKKRLVCVPAVLGRLYNVTIRVFSATTLAALQFDVDYGAADGGFEGMDASVSCSSAVTGSTFVRDSDADATLIVAFLPNVGSEIVGPADLMTCRFSRATGTPATTSFTVTVVAAVDVAGNEVTPDVRVSSVSVVP